MNIEEPNGIERMPDEDLVDFFLNGHCAAFAIAATRAMHAAGRTGVGISILVDEDGEPNSQDDRCVFHAYASCDGFDADAKGIRTAGEMEDDYDVGPVEIDGPFDEEDFTSFFCGDDGLEADPVWIGAAEDLIARNPSLITPSIENDPR